MTNPPLYVQCIAPFLGFPVLPFICIAHESPIFVVIVVVVVVVFY